MAITEVTVLRLLAGYMEDTMSVIDAIRDGLIVSGGFIAFIFGVDYLLYRRKKKK